MNGRAVRALENLCMTDKPPYRVPSMAEIAALEPCGINVISTFSGCGGSSLGYRLAGCTVLAANEFVPAAAEVYRANASPSTVVIEDDIRSLSGADLLAAAGLEVGELDILDGSPPCSGFSTAGKKSKGWGEVKKYSDTKQRVDDLFYEYARILKQMQPRMFVAENVEGLVKGESKGYFKRIYAELEAAGYRVRAAVLDASRLGVPQRRKRLIFIGVRNDLGVEPRHPSPLPYVYTMRDALPWLSGQIKPGSGGNGWATNPGWNDANTSPSVTIGASPQTGNGRFPAEIVEGDVSFVTVPKWGGPKNGEVSLDEPSYTITAGGVSNTTQDRFAILNSEFVFKKSHTKDLTSRSVDKPFPTVSAHGIGAVHQIEGGFVTADSAECLDPETGQDLRRVATVIADKYPNRNLRRLSIAEVRRLCSFPDDFVLLGNHTQRWERLGRSVPPVMMQHIAAAVINTLRQCAD